MTSVSRLSIFRPTYHMHWKKTHALKTFFTPFFLFVIQSLIMSLGALSLSAQAAPTNVDYAMYFLADVRDNEHCAMHVTDGKIVVDNDISNPAMTCPDMTSWRLFTEVIRDKFWSNWADEGQNWPAQPWPLCKQGDDPATCCQVGSPNNSKEHCPVFPGNSTTPTLLTAKAVNHVGHPALTHHLQELTTPEDIDEAVNSIKTMNTLSAEDAQVPACTQKDIDNLIPKTYESIGRVVRQTNSEITVRNKVFHDYLFANNLYNSDGVADVFSVNKKNQLKNAPYAADSQSASTAAPAKLSKIDFPTKAIMIKSNWLYEGVAQKLGIKNNKDKTFITQKLTTIVPSTNKAVANGKCAMTGTHYLMAFHISSKDTPNWVWTTFEHIAMPGRCDLTGCNDAYGYATTDKIPAGAAKNYVAPHVKSDDLTAGPSTVFDRDKLYAVEPINDGLNKVLSDLNIGATPATNKDQPSPSDLAWRNYRLKGSQVDFVNSMGRKTTLGNSITEAGFMEGVSCITCHARAGINVTGKNKVDFFHLSVFVKSLSDFGYGLSANSIPNEAWFHLDNNPGTLTILQTDFVWGFFNANPLVKTNSSAKAGEK